ncbi:hypothetical protein RRG08_052959 [Elysia crispata]|uniref:Uncharacterized protein n=1 Tax=Elysia crispata TaxID=231223 RepID=A0AAE0ZJK1_9GAST|nr:hypothetical protein RRG08_052959 [Elysia crispata]
MAERHSRERLVGMYKAASMFEPEGSWPEVESELGCDFKTWGSPSHASSLPLFGTANPMFNLIAKLDQDSYDTQQL